MATSFQEEPFRFPIDAFLSQAQRPFNYNLQNENLFPIEHFLPFRRGGPAAARSFSAMQPALGLISRIILTRPSTFGIFVKRAEAGSEDVFLDDSTEIPVPDDEIITAIKTHMHFFELSSDPMSSFSETIFNPKSTRDTVCLDYSLVEALHFENDGSNSKPPMLFFLAALIGHEIAHILEFRCIRSGRLNGDNAFVTPPGLTCREAGTAWEVRTFGGGR
ncbi:hypothetical protein N7495_005705 [Penicillium taxi]|uniref:uncharacterized protein n=1 Tax=Penicillium taxi TaxID=168475 RepID=UPI00254507D8|nr:uncharacterized protein N7495_005705 [Penicillium taxi]KAJ5894014.1 hypothetical protein N7495_005705 [Penicillium taxi]